MSPRASRALFWVGLLLVVIFALGLVQSILMPFATGFAIAYVLAPGVARLERLGVRRSLASLAVVVLFLFGIALLLVVLVPLIQGQIVQLIARMPNLVRETQDPGSYSVPFGPGVATVDGGRVGALGPGVYFYRFRAGMFESTRRMLLMR